MKEDIIILNITIPAVAFAERGAGNSMVNKYIEWLNANKVGFSIQDLYEENEIDYALLFVDQKKIVAVKVGYETGEVYFLPVENDRKNNITSVFSERQNTKYISGKNILI